MIYNIREIINVNMYNSILNPDVTLDEDEEISEERWSNFDCKQYVLLVCERAVIELKKLLQRLPDWMKCMYVEDSAYIDSPQYYNYRGDVFCFQIDCEAQMSSDGMQKYLNNFFDDDWNAEFGATYKIFEYISGNCSVESFPLANTDIA